jgi:hypothetical protein
MDDDMAARLKAMFPGDLVPTDDDEVPHVPLRVRRQILGGTIRHVEPLPAPETAAKFARLMATLPPPELPTVPPPVVPSVPRTVLEKKENADLWLREAKDLQSDVVLGYPVEPHHVTRLLLEAIPVVEHYASRP